MTRPLEQALEKVRQLPDEQQDLAADILFALAAKHESPEELDEETIAAVNEGLAQAERGEFVSDEEMAEFFRRHGA